MANALTNIDEADRYQLPEEDEEAKGGGSRFAWNFAADQRGGKGSRQLQRFA